MPFPTERGERRESLKVSAHEKLGEVLRILRTILKNYSPILHSELMSAASQLISLVNGECVGGDLVSAWMEFAPQMKIVIFNFKMIAKIVIYNIRLLLCKILLY